MHQCIRFLVDNVLNKVSLKLVGDVDESLKLNWTHSPEHVMFFLCLLVWPSCFHDAWIPVSACYAFAGRLGLTLVLKLFLR